jgi:hypothetical protein
LWTIIQDEVPLHGKDALMNRPRSSVLTATLILGCWFLLDAVGEVLRPADRERARKLMKDGNYKEAYNEFSALALDPQDDPKEAGGDLQNAIQCLRNINRSDEIDPFREKVVAAHAKNWRLLWSAAQSFLHGDHYGYMIAGEFKRGHHRGGGRVANPYNRDRVRALQLCAQAMPFADQDADKTAAAQFYLNFASTLMGVSGYNEAWRLQDLTDLGTLPDYDEGWWYGYHGGRGAPVDEAGNPVFHKLPKSWAEAKSDGERWRWALLQAMELAPAMADTVRRQFADFHLNQFGVQTMAEYGHFFGRRSEADETRKDESGTWELHTLGEDETIAKLATGIKRFKLPDEFNYIKVYQQLQANSNLADIFTNRRQYPKGAEYWVKHLEQTNQWASLKDKPYTHRADRVHGWPQLCQIRGNWGSLEPLASQPAGKGATVEYRYRNGNKVHFEAFPLDVPKLLNDVKAYIETKPRQLDWEKMNVQDIGWHVVQKSRTQYQGERVAAWDLDLKPREGHFDRRVTVATPLQKAGAWLITAQMDGGNESLMVLWIADTVLVKKPVDQGVFYYVADAVTGQPVPKANLEFFGYRQEWVNEPRGQGWYRIHTRRFAEFSDADGQLVLGNNRQPNDHQWIISATTPEGRLAWLGFTGAWYGVHHDAEYDQDKTYVITDRPVYRPNQPVKFKAWVNKAQYDREGKSPYAGSALAIEVRDPRNQVVYEKSLTADEYGGVDGELTLDSKATLGVYRLIVAHRGQGTFRLEEYKKPEFEVKVEAPSEPVMLGEKITAKVQAKYYFGAPVTEAKVKYKVHRSEHDARWYPVCRWDWFYGPGYWWFSPDYVWWPGWNEWGCKRPIPWWYWNWRGWRQPPEVVAEGEAALGADGTLSIPIDTSLAKAVHPDQDHRYEVIAEVTDASRRTIVGQGEVLVARKPFKVHVWMNRGWYRTGDDIQAEFVAQTLDRKPVTKSKTSVKLLKVSYDKDGKPVENAVQNWDFETNEEGRGRLQMKAAEAGQYRLSVTVTDAKNRAIEGGAVFVARGEAFEGSDFRFNDIELVTDRAEYKPGDSVRLMVNVDRRDAPVLLFTRPANGIYLKPKLLRIKGKSAVEMIEVAKKDMPNFFVEALTVAGGKVHGETREVIVPPESRVLDIKVEPSATEYKPGEKAKVKVKVTDSTGEPYAGSLVVSLYDKSVEYISGGSNVPEIKSFFWKWRRHHRENTEHSLNKGGYPMLRPNRAGMGHLGVFGALVADELEGRELQQGGEGGGGRPRGKGASNALGEFAGARRAAEADGAPPAPSAANAPMEKAKSEDKKADRESLGGPGGAEPPPMAQPTIRTKFADTALWVASLNTNAQGQAEVELTMPENLTTWKARVWGMGGGARCGEASVEVVTKKNLILRLQAPRFFTQKDEVVLSANVHNYLKGKKTARVVLELEGKTLEPMAGGGEVSVEIDPNGEKRVDWRVRVLQPGEAVVRMKALTDEESDAMEMRFPVYVHGMLKTESFCGVIRPDKERSVLSIRVPEERRPEETRLEIRYSPTLAMAMVDALPYMVEYPYGCTEQTLNRFLPTVVTQKVLLRMGVDLKDVQRKITNLNAQEIGEDAKRAADWQRLVGTKRWDGQHWVDRNPVFDETLVLDMVKAGVEKLTAMQNGDGGWGWFSGWAESSWPHTTAVVVHGLQVARENDVALVPGILDRGLAWLKRRQAEQVRLLKNAPGKVHPWKDHADNLDALVYMVLADEKADNAEMKDFLFRDRNHLSVYAKAMAALAFHKMGHAEQRDMLRRNIEQFLVQDDENQTAYLKLGNEGYWWWWYGSEYEAHAFYLKLLAAVDPKGDTASRLVKYLLNNRRHATYWHSTRDTSYIIEAFADYLKASGEDKPDLTVEILVDGKKSKEVKIGHENLFTYDNKLVMKGQELAAGAHAIEVRKKGTGPVYWNAYLTNFTLEDFITKAGLEVKVERRVFKLVPVDKKIKDEGVRGQSVDRKVEKYERKPLENDATLKSGDLVEVELVMESKNDYEYIFFEDMKAAGFEPVDVRSGYGRNEMGAYMELRDERVTFFVRALARGKHSLSYRLRAEIPGRFSALPAKASAMYAPELKANSDEIKLRIED